MNTTGAAKGEHSPHEKMAGYNINVDAIRDVEYPMLEGTYP